MAVAFAIHDNPTGLLLVIALLLAVLLLAMATKGEVAPRCALGIALVRGSQMRTEQRNTESTNLFLRRGLAVWFVQVLVLAIFAALLMFSHPAWVDHFERLRLVRNFMANPVEMIVIEAFGTLCLLVGISGVMESDGSFLDTAREG